VLSKHPPGITWNLNFYAMNKAGQHGGAAIREGSRYAVCDADGTRLVESAWVLERSGR
jgi:hypothetical protein